MGRFGSGAVRGLHIVILDFAIVARVSFGCDICMYPSGVFVMDQARYTEGNRGA